MKNHAVLWWILWIFSAFIFAMTEDGENCIEYKPTMTNVVSTLSFLTSILSFVLAVVFTAIAFFTT